MNCINNHINETPINVSAGHQSNELYQWVSGQSWMCILVKLWWVTHWWHAVNTMKPLCGRDHDQSVGNYPFQDKYSSFKGERLQWLSIYWCLRVAGKPTGSEGFKAFQENGLWLLLSLQCAARDIICPPGSVFLFPRHLTVLTVAQSLNAETLLMKSDCK